MFANLLLATALSVAGFCEKAERHEPLTVAFFGGSLTWGANATDPNYTSWRGRICERLRQTYPNTPFRFVDAAIGGTGSELGVFRLERDVLAYKPDLLFHEWSVNDGFARSNDNASCSYEGILRRVLKEAPGCVPVTVILPDRKTMTIEPEDNLKRRAEHLAIAENYNLNVVDILGKLRREYQSGKDETDKIWPAKIGDNTHPHDYGYGRYAEIVWDSVFAHPSDRLPKLTREPMFSPKYDHVCRQRLNTLGWMPAGWETNYNAMRAGTFDFLCSRRQDGIVRASNKDGVMPAPFRLQFRGEVLLIYGESTVDSGKCEVWVDGKRAGFNDCAAFAKWFAPSAYLNWPIASNLDPDKVHELEIRPVLEDGKVQEVNLESVCVAGRNGAWVKLADDSAVDGYMPLVRKPDAIEANGAAVEIVPDGDKAEVFIIATDPLERVTLSWNVDFPEAEVLGDHWERTYVDTYWRPVRIPRAMPWYFLCKTRGRTDGYAVMTQPNAFASWRTDGRKLTLTIDVRAAGKPVNLKGRRLHAVTLVSRKGREGESAYAAGRAFCRMMCPKPRLAKTPVYGYNDWYCAYGKQTAANFFRDATPVIELCKGLENRPYVVVDDGWQHNDEPRQTAAYWGDWAWTRSSDRFGMPMDEFAKRVTALGAKPGLWYRPLDFWTGANANERQLDCKTAFDPTVPSVMKRIREDMVRFRTWGMKLVKIDFLTHDVTGTWPCDFGEDLERALDSNRRWRDDSRTTVEVMKELYETLREGAGDEVVIIGCNALNHLAAGLFEVQRTGDDTSGKTWEQTRADGVNTMGMRAIQNGVFFQCDPDCVGLAEKDAVPWSRNAQFMEAVARSGQSLFVSWRNELMDDAVRAGLKSAFATASVARENGEPLDWEKTPLPSVWKFADGERTFDWSDVPPAPDSELQQICQRLCDEAVASGEQGGVQFCAYRDGKCIVDVCAGTLSTNAGAAKVTKDTLFPIFSTEKPLLATAVHKAVQLGQMDYDKPLCTWWPELTGEGKEKLTLRETLAYRSGMPGGTPGKLRRCDLVDWSRVLKTAAADKPELEPGTKQRYMPVSYAWFLGHPLEVATGMPLNDALREYVLIPAGIERDFYFAAPGEGFPRIAEFSHCDGFVAEMNNAYARKTCIPSCWAVASARAIARFYDRLCGYHGWKPLIWSGILNEAIKPCRHADDPLPADMNKKWYMLFGMGYGLWGEDTNINRIIGHGGAGGSEGLVDRERKLAIGYTCNFDNHKGGLRARLYKAVGMKWRYWKDSDADIQTIQLKSDGRTMCNPLPIEDYPLGVLCRGLANGSQPTREPETWLTPDGKTCQFRELADPAILCADGKWYLYPSAEMCYRSDDGGSTWKHIPLHLSGADGDADLVGYAPTVVAHRGGYLLAGSNGNVYRSSSPEGPFRLLGHLDLPERGADGVRVPRFWDPDFFSDDDGRLYLYWGCSPTNGIWGCELDASDPLKVVSSPRRLIAFELDTQPWEIAPNKNPTCAFIEGAWMVKHDGKYILTYSAAGTENREYAMGQAVGTSPLGSFVKPKNNPFLQQASGLITGTAHGAVAKGPDGGYWVVYTIRASTVHWFERRIGLDRVTFAADGSIAVMKPTSTPQWSAGAGTASPGWVCLAGQSKPSAAGALDEDLGTYWTPTAVPEDLAVDFGTERTVRSFRLIWRDGGLDTERGVRRGPFRYRVDYLDVQQVWRPLVDASANDRDLLVDYRETEAVRTRSVRLTVLGGPRGIVPQVVDFSVFGL